MPNFIIKPNSLKNCENLTLFLSYFWKYENYKTYRKILIDGYINCDCDLVVET